MNLFIKEKELEKIVLSYMLEMRRMEDRTNILIREQIDGLGTRLLLSIHQNIKNKDVSKKYEMLYYHLSDIAELADQYRERFDLEGAVLETEPVRGILRGLYDAFSNLFNPIKGHRDNPITYERMVLISSGILKIKQQMMDSLEKYPPVSLGDHLSQGELLNLMENEVRNYYNSIYDVTLERIQDTLDSLSIKEEAKKHLKIYKALGLLLEDVTNLDSVSFFGDLMAEELAAAGNLRGILDEMHEVYKNKLSVVDSWQQMSTDISEILSKEEIDELIENHIFIHTDHIKGHLDKLEQINQEAISELMGIAMVEIDYAVTAAIGEVRQKSGPFALLSANILEIMSQAASKTANLEPKDGDELSKIFRGIGETMTLKAESLRDKDTNYQIDKKEFQIQLRQNLESMKGDFTKQAPRMFEAAVSGDTAPFIQFQQKFLRQVENHLEQHRKKDLQYLRESILFELRTLEELSNQSVTRYVSMGGYHAKALTQIMKDLIEDIRDCLMSYKIHLILPKAHDAFEAKKHEVMTATHQEGFEAGEIVKCLNAGYQLEDNIVLRASVVAAR